MIPFVKNIVLCFLVKGRALRDPLVPEVNANFTNSSKIKKNYFTVRNILFKIK